MRYYQRCPDCRARMRLIEKAKETIGYPPVEAERAYVCPDCRNTWTLHVGCNLIAPGRPTPFVKHAGASGAQPRSS
jgi:transposase-like protein